MGGGNGWRKLLAWLKGLGGVLELLGYSAGA